MAKRYHASKKSLEHRDYYAGHESRMHQEREDGGMLNDDKSAMANMPQNIIMKYYPEGYGYLPEDLKDDIRSVDHQIGMDDSKRREHFKPKKV